MILTIDIGTSYLKTALLSDNLSVLNIQSLPISSDNPESWIYSIKKSVTFFKDELNYNLNKINIIAVCGNGPTLIPFSKKTNLTAYSWEENKNQTFIKSALYIKKKYPKIYSKTEFFLSCPELILYLLTDIPTTCSPPVNLEFFYWDKESLLEAKLDPNLFPPFTEYGLIIGKTTEYAKKIFNIPSGIPVLSACIDFMADLVGTNSFNSGNICNRTGTAETVNIISYTPFNNPNFLCYKHPFNKDVFNISCKTTDKDINKKISFLKDVFQNNEFTQYDKITTCGYLSNDDKYNQLKANILKKEIIKCEVTQTGILGMGILAKSCLERIDLKKLSEKTVKIDKTYLPEPK